MARQFWTFQTIRCASTPRTVVISATSNGSEPEQITSNDNVLGFCRESQLAEVRPPKKNGDSVTWVILLNRRELWICHQFVPALRQLWVLQNCRCVPRPTYMVARRPKPCVNIKTVFPRYRNPILKIRRSRDRHIYNMGIPILAGKTTSLYWDGHLVSFCLFVYRCASIVAVAFFSHHWIWYPSSYIAVNYYTSLCWPVWSTLMRCETTVTLETEKHV